MEEEERATQSFMVVSTISMDLETTLVLRVNRPK